jgi:hypothetical protein
MVARGHLLHKFISACVICAMLFFSSGCASYAPARVAYTKDTSARTFQEAGGIHIALMQLSDTEAKAYFQRNLSGKGITPVFLTVMNESPHGVEVKRDGIVPLPYPASQVAEMAEFNVPLRVVWFSPLLISIFLWPLLIPVVMNGAGAVKANADMLSDYCRKEFTFGRIEPKDSRSGFLFLSRSADSTVRVNVFEEMPGEVKERVFTLIPQ